MKRPYRPAEVLTRAARLAAHRHARAQLYAEAALITAAACVAGDALVAAMLAATPA